MDLRSLRCFVAVAEELHFGRAAQRLHISQPPLSHTIHTLEASLGVLLFERTRRHVSLTHAGTVLLERARILLCDAERAVVAAQRASRGEIGRLSVGFILAATHHLLPQTLRGFRRRMPEVELSLREMPIREQLSALEEGIIDVGFVRPPVDTAVIAAQTLLEEPFLVALPQGHPLTSCKRLTLARLATESFVMSTPGRSPLYTQIISACAAAGFTPRVVQDAAHTVTVIGLVRAGMGIALVPQSVRALRPAGVTLCPLSNLAVRAETAIAWRRDDMSPVRLAFFAAACAAAAVTGGANVRMRGAWTRLGVPAGRVVVGWLWPGTCTRYAFAAEHIDAPQAILGLRDESQPRGVSGTGVAWLAMFGEYATRDIFIDLETEGVGSPLCDAQTYESLMAALHFDDVAMSPADGPLGSGLRGRPQGEKSMRYFRSTNA